MQPVSSPVAAAARPRSRTAVLVSADRSFRQRLSETLTGLRWKVREAESGAEAWEAAEGGAPEAVIVDSWLPDLDLAEFLTDFHGRFPQVDLVSAGGAHEGEGPRGPYRQELLYAMRRSQDTDTAAWNTAPSMGNSSPSPAAVAPAPWQIAAAQASVAAPLALGESAAYSGGGTLFLDEIGEMPLGLQSKLLRFVESSELQRVAGSRSLGAVARGPGPLREGGPRTGGPDGSRAGASDRAETRTGETRTGQGRAGQGRIDQAHADQGHAGRALRKEAADSISSAERPGMQAFAAAAQVVASMGAGHLGIVARAPAEGIHAAIAQHAAPPAVALGVEPILANTSAVMASHPVQAQGSVANAPHGQATSEAVLEALENSSGAVRAQFEPPSSLPARATAERQSLRAGLTGFGDSSGEGFSASHGEAIGLAAAKPEASLSEGSFPSRTLPSNGWMTASPQQVAAASTTLETAAPKTDFGREAPSDLPSQVVFSPAEFGHPESVPSESGPSESGPFKSGSSGLAPSRSDSFGFGSDRSNSVETHSAVPDSAAPDSAEPARTSVSSPKVVLPEAALPALASQHFTASPALAGGLDSSAILPEHSAASGAADPGTGLLSGGESRHILNGDPGASSAAAAVAAIAQLPGRPRLPADAAVVLPASRRSQEGTAIAERRLAAVTHAAGLAGETGLLRGPEGAGFRPSGELPPLHTAGSSSARGQTFAALETFAALDGEAGGGAKAPTLTRAGAAQIEAGFADPALGWIGVRADKSGGGVHAMLLPGSAETARELSGHMQGLSEYLAVERSPVESLGMAAPATGNPWQGSSGSMHGAAGHGGFHEKDSAAGQGMGGSSERGSGQNAHRETQQDSSRAGDSGMVGAAGPAVKSRTLPEAAPEAALRHRGGPGPAAGQLSTPLAEPMTAAGQRSDGIHGVVAEHISVMA